MSFNIPAKDSPKDYYDNPNPETYPDYDTGHWHKHRFAGEYTYDGHQKCDIAYVPSHGGYGWECKSFVTEKIPTFGGGDVGGSTRPNFETRKEQRKHAPNNMFKRGIGTPGYESYRVADEVKANEEDFSENEETDTSETDEEDISDTEEEDNGETYSQDRSPTKMEESEKVTIVGPEDVDDAGFLTARIESVSEDLDNVEASAWNEATPSLGKRNDLLTFDADGIPHFGSNEQMRGFDQITRTPATATVAHVALSSMAVPTAIASMQQTIEIAKSHTSSTSVPHHGFFPWREAIAQCAKAEIFLLLLCLFIFGILVAHWKQSRYMRVERGVDHEEQASVQDGRHPGSRWPIGKDRKTEEDMNV